MGIYAGKILDGAKPEDLPVMGALKVEFSARAHNWTVALDATVKLITGAIGRMASDKVAGLFRARRGRQD